MTDDKRKPDQTSLGPSILQGMNYFQGFSESYASLTPDDYIKTEMLHYPALRAAIKLVYYPMLAARYRIIEGDEATVRLLNVFFDRYYQRAARNLLSRGVGWGFAAGEKIYRGMMIDNKARWMLSGIIVPPSREITINYKEPFQIDGFTWNGVKVDADRMAYYVYQGDEVGKPRGCSAAEDAYWAWKMAMEDWSRWSVWKDLRSVPPLKIFYPQSVETPAAGSAKADPNQTLADEIMKKSRNLAGITLPKVWSEEKQEYLSVWDAVEMEVSDKNPGFDLAIKKDDSMVFISVFAPERLILQDSRYGNYSVAEAQKDFYADVTEARLEEWEEFLNAYITDPLQLVNFGKISARVELDFDDRMRTWYLDLIKQVATGSMAGTLPIDYDKLLAEYGIPIIDQKSRSIQSHEHSSHKTIDLAEGMTNKELKAKVRVEEENQVKRLNREEEEIAVGIYDRVKEELRVEQGKGALRIGKIYDSYAVPPAEEFAKAVQIPARIFNDLWSGLLKVWESGMAQAMEKIGIRYMKEPGKQASEELYSVAIGWEGFYKGNIEIAGEGERLESRLFSSVLNKPTKAEALKAYNDAFNKYIEELLPDRLRNELHKAVNIGIKDAVREHLERKAKEQAGK